MAETWPTDIVPDHVEWALLGNSQSFVSELNGAEQTLDLPGSRWRANLTFTNRQGAKGRRLRAFLAALGSRAGRVYLPPHDALEPAGTGLGAPLVASGSTAGKSLPTSGWTPNRHGILLAGDYVSYGDGELNMLAADADSNGSGLATLSLVRPVRVDPTVGTALVISRPAALMAPADDQQLSWAVSSPALYSFSISFLEVLSV